MHEGEYLKTPKTKITLGQICRDEFGNPALSVKRGKKDEYEKVPIPYLINLLSNVQSELTVIRQMKEEVEII